MGSYLGNVVILAKVYGNGADTVFGVGGDNVAAVKTKPIIIKRKCIRCVTVGKIRGV